MYSERVSAYIKGLTAYLVQAELKNKVVFPKVQSNPVLHARMENKHLYHILFGARDFSFLALWTILFCPQSGMLIHRHTYTDTQDDFDK